jgi:hypothetical protein
MAALLLLMLEAESADLVFTISLKRSTPKIVSYPQVARPITPSLGEARTGSDRLTSVRTWEEQTFRSPPRTGRF